MDCSSDTGLVSWEQEERGALYRVHAHGADGHAVECSGAAGGCQLPGMHCGQHYNLTVTVLDGHCDNVKYDLALQSAPCRPTNVRTSLQQCPSTLATVTWEHASGAASYAAAAVTAGGDGADSCNATAATSCQLQQLLCGKTYNVSVVSRDEGCDSAESEPAHLTTAPCAPQNVTLDMQCETGNLTASWAHNPDADSFETTVVSHTGAQWFCMSTSCHCSVENIDCGHHLTVTVVAVTGGCESEPSAPVAISSVPPGGSRGIARPDEMYNPSSEFWVYPGVSYQLDLPGKPPREGAQEAS
ncbi:Fibronectin type III domain-containing protein 7 [Merluccius polli]|uniref:Fibronectin type III domain-containing protein 7 n=1 Tax=Merluccius polli TaxID=89951 RepID=A0AA47LZ56_MERPO|nr:Fibronectin type III domain-containing protein 7 [Merluccius polli]